MPQSITNLNVGYFECISCMYQELWGWHEDMAQPKPMQKHVHFLWACVYSHVYILCQILKYMQIKKEFLLGFFHWGNISGKKELVRLWCWIQWDSSWIGGRVMEFELATFLESIWKRYISCNLETFIPFNPVIPLLEMGSYKIIKNEIQKST